VNEKGNETTTKDQIQLEQKFKWKAGERPGEKKDEKSEN